MTPEIAQVFANFTRSVGVAFEALADEIEALPLAEAAGADEGDGVDLADLGPRQRDIVNVLRDAGDAGLTGAQVSNKIPGYDSANALTALRALQQKRPPVVEEIPGEQPKKWRLTPFILDADSDPYLVTASLVQAGEWTTYGEISKAVRGRDDDTAARAIGQKAAKNPNFPSPHRVLSKGGKISKFWKSADSEKPNPEECKRRLEREGVRFDYLGQAYPYVDSNGDGVPEVVHAGLDKKSYVNADELRRRLQERIAKKTGT